MAVRPIDPALPSYQKAQACARMHREAILASAQCACFSCFTRFEPTRVTKWIDAGQTALCPRCGLDTVLGAASMGIDDQFLRLLNTHVAAPAPRVPATR